jgi:uncharacterized membrane protein
MAKRRRRSSQAERRVREQELRKEQNSETIRKLMILVVIVAIVAVAWWAFGGGGSGPEPTAGLTINDAGEVELSASEVTKEAKFYNIDASGVEVRFFAVRGSDNKVRVAMDACDVCYDAKKGYRQGGDDMVCNNCGNKYPTDGIGTENLKGGCWPSYVPMKVEDGKVIIKASELKAKRYMFD